MCSCLQKIEFFFSVHLHYCYLYFYFYILIIVNITLSSRILLDSYHFVKDFEGIEEQSASSTNRVEGSEESHIEHPNISIAECSMSGSWMSSTTATDVTHGKALPTIQSNYEFDF